MEGNESQTEIEGGRESKEVEGKGGEGEKWIREMEEHTKALPLTFSPSDSETKISNRGGLR